MRVYLRGKTYHFELEFKGVAYRRSTKSKNLRVAETIAAAFRTALAKGEVGITERRKAPMFDHAMKEFLAWSVVEHHDHPNTPKRSKTSSKPLLKFFGKTILDKISVEDVENYKKTRSAENGKRTDRKLKPATVNRELACLREMFNHSRKGYPDLRNPVSRVKLLPEDNLQERILTYAEQRAYLAAASEQLKDIAGMILGTGMRPIEVFSLPAHAVYLEEGYLRVLKSKTKAGKRRIELNAETREILTRRKHIYPNGYLFPHDTDPTRHVPKVDSSHRPAVKNSKVAWFKPYDLRHTWATRAAEAGIDLVTLAAMMGHSRIQMVMRYAHPTQIHQANAMEKLTAFNAERESREKSRAKLEEARREGKPTLHIIPKSA